ncbi:MAG: hypothetical protein QOG00_1353 [Pyrinomonadaceae bacterium]|nr:hypothetical protein [Pyrinomonadaceae bacterium]
MNLASGRREDVVNAVVRADRKTIDFKPLKSYEKVYTEALMDFQQPISQSMIGGCVPVEAYHPCDGRLLQAVSRLNFKTDPY